MKPSKTLLPALLLPLLVLDLPCMAQSVPNPPTNHVHSFPVEVIDTHITAPAISAKATAPEYCLLNKEGKAEISFGGVASLAAQGSHETETRFLPCGCGEPSDEEPYFGSYGVQPEQYTYHWAFMPVSDGAENFFEKSGVGPSFNDKVTVTVPGVYSVDGNFVGIRICSLCRCEAGDLKEIRVYELIPTCPPWIGIDRTDAGPAEQERYGDATLTPDDSSSWSWAHRGVCTLTSQYSKAVTYKTTSKEACSSSYLDQELEVTALITSPIEASLSAKTNFTVVKVDVTVGSSAEATEEVSSEYVPYVADAPDGTLADFAGDLMTAVSITCTPANLPYGEVVKIEAPAGFLYVKEGDDFVPAEGEYQASEIGSKEFFIHGHAEGDFGILVWHPTSDAKDLANVTVYNFPFTGECEDCASCSDQTEVKNKCIYFAQAFGRTPWVAGAPKGVFRVYENIPTNRLGRPAMFRYDHPVNRRIVSRYGVTNYIAILDPQGRRISYINGIPANESSGMDMQCVIGADGLVNEILPDRTRVVYGADNAVLKLVTPDGVAVAAADLGIKVIRNENGIRQVWSKTDGLLDVVWPQNSHETVVSWYPPSAVDPQTDASGLYTFTGSPAKTFTFHCTFQSYFKWVSGPKCPICEDYGGHQAYDYVICGSKYELSGVTYGLTLAEQRGTEFIFQYEWKFDRYDNDWTFTKGTGDDFIKDRLIHIRAPGTSTVTRVRTDISGKVSTHEKKIYKNDRYGVRLISRSAVRSDGVEQVSYTAKPITNGVLVGRIAADMNEYGNSTSYQHDGYGRVITESTVIAGGIAQVTSYGYSGVSDAEGIDRRPASVTVSQNGVVTSSTHYSYKGAFAVNGSDVLGLCDTVTRTDPMRPGVSLKSYTHYYSPTSGIAIGRGRVRLTVNPDGSATHYAYAGDDNSWTETVTQGYFDASVAGASDLDELFRALPGKSARTVNTHDFRGDIVLTESYVNTGGNVFTYAGWTTNSYNIMHKQLGSKRHDGTSEMSNWICTGPVWQRNADGTSVTNTFDSAKRIKTSTHYTPFGNVTRTYNYDSDGRVVSQTTATNGVTVGCGAGCGSTYSEFDTQGRTVLSVDSMGRTNRTSYSLDNRTVTHTDPAGAVVVESYSTDGSLVSRIGTVMRAEYYTKGVDAATGTRWTKTTYGTPTGADYAKSYYNALNQLVLQERPGFGGATLKTVYAYNSKGQLESESRLVQGGTGTYDLPVTTYAYNQLGDRVATTQTAANVSRIQSSDSTFSVDNNIVRQTSISVASCSDAAILPMTNSVITRLYPLGEDADWLLAESRSRDVRGNETVQKVVQNSTTYERTTTVSNATSVLPAISISLAGLTLSSKDQHGCATIYGYDVLMRQISAETSSSSNNERLTGSYTHYNLIGQVDYTEDAFASRTVYGYDSTGRRISTTQYGKATDPVLTTYTAFDAANRTLAAWGATYPVAYEYDAAGRMTAMYTYRGTAAIASYSDIVALKPQMDRTQWLYDQTTGLLTNKLYADGKGPAYSYTALGQLSTRKWARLSTDNCPLITEYFYNSFGSLTNTAYSDGTPSVSFTYNALGQMKTVTDASGTRAIEYAADGQMLAETLAFNTSLFTLHEKCDNLGRSEGYALSNEVAQISGTMQGFDIYGRLNQVAVDGISGAFTYGYLEGSHLQKTLAMPNGVTRTFGYEASRDLLTSIIHSNATERLVQRDFTFDGFGRLIDRALVRASGSSSATPDAFGYNLRSELTNAVINANAFAYNFDPIGNRNSATEFGTNTSYTASALNQYTSITPVAPAGNPFTPAFDLDGNQTLLKTTTGIWHVWYNAENRPILFSNSTTKVEMAYDYMGRRFEYKETVNGTLTRHERCLYRDYLQIAALDMLNSASVKHSIAWDPSEPTATRPLALQIGANAYYYSFDQVKNVTELFDSTGALAVAYDYSPFGQVTSVLSVGTSAFDVASNPLTFSSEVHDSILGLQYYNYRHLNLLDGRWANRDPIEEEGGFNLFSFINNNVLSRLDYIGLADVPAAPDFDNGMPGLPLLDVNKYPNSEDAGGWIQVQITAKDLCVKDTEGTLQFNLNFYYHKSSKGRKYFPPEDNKGVKPYCEGTVSFDGEALKVSALNNGSPTPTGKPEEWTWNTKGKKIVTQYWSWNAKYTKKVGTCPKKEEDEALIEISYREGSDKRSSMVQVSWTYSCKPTGGINEPFHATVDTAPANNPDPNEVNK